MKSALCIIALAFFGGPLLAAQKGTDAQKRAKAVEDAKRLREEKKAEEELKKAAKKRRAPEKQKRKPPEKQKLPEKLPEPTSEYLNRYRRKVNDWYARATTDAKFNLYDAQLEAIKRLKNAVADLEKQLHNDPESAPDVDARLREERKWLAYLEATKSRPNPRITLGDIGKKAEIGDVGHSAFGALPMHEVIDENNVVARWNGALCWIEGMKTKQVAGQTIPITNVSRHLFAVVGTKEYGEVDGIKRMLPVLRAIDAAMLLPEKPPPKDVQKKVK